MLELLKKAIKRIFPELEAGLHYDRLARVLAVADAPEEGCYSEDFRPRFSCELQILGPDMEPDSKFPVMTGVPLPVPGMGQEGGLYLPPQPGSVASIGFAYGRADRPLIRNIYPHGSVLPGVKPDEMLLQKNAECYQKADSTGNWERKTSTNITDDAENIISNAGSIIDNAQTYTGDVTGHYTLDVGGIYDLKASLVEVLSSMGINMGTLADINVTAGGNQTSIISGNDSEKIGGSQSSTVSGSRSGKISGSDTLKISKDRKTEIKGSSKEKSLGEMTHQASVLNFISSSTISFTSLIDGEESSVNLFQELLSCLDGIIAALRVLASHDHPDTGTISQGSSVSSSTSTAQTHRSNLGRITA